MTLMQQYGHPSCKCFSATSKADVPEIASVSLNDSVVISCFTKHDDNIPLHVRNFSNQFPKLMIECFLVSLSNLNLHAIVVSWAYPIENQEMHLKGATWVKLTADSNGLVANDGLSVHFSMTLSFLPSCV